MKCPTFHTRDRYMQLSNSIMTDKEKTNKIDALEEIQTRIGGAFGTADLIFAGHPLDEGRAKELRTLAFANNITLNEIQNISLGYLYRKNCSHVHTKEQLKKVTKFFGKKLK